MAQLGPALAWAVRNDITSLELIVDDQPPPSVGKVSSEETAEAAAAMARRAGYFRLPINVWRLEGRKLRPQQPGALKSLPDRAQLLADRPDLAATADRLRAHGVDPLIEGDFLVGEVLGLEVARAPLSPPSELQVGTGSHDREARVEMRPGEQHGAALDEVVEVIHRYRRPATPRHPANTLAREKWLRSVVLALPAVAGGRILEPVPALDPPSDLRTPTVAAAAGAGADGRALVVACSVGVNLDLVPTGADQRAHVAEHARLALIVPEGDDYGVTRQLAALLKDPADVITVPRDWPRLLEQATSS